MKPPYDDPLAHALFLDRCARDIRYLYEAVGLRRKFGDMPEHLVMFHELVKECEGRGENLQLLAPKSHLKSTGLKLDAIQYELGVDPGLLFSTASPIVRDITNDWIMRQLEYLLGETGTPWNIDLFNLPNHDPALLMPSFVGMTCGTYVEGVKMLRRRNDDLIDFRSTHSEVERERAKEWYSLVNQERVVEEAHGCDYGSPWHPNDLFVWNARNGLRTEIFPMFRCDRPKGWDSFPNVNHHGDEYDVLWGEKFGEYDAESYRKHRTMARGKFELICQCNPWGTDMMRFKPEWFQYFDTVPQTQMSRLRIVAGDDPAVSEKEIAKNSDSAIVIVGYDGEADIIYVLDAVAFQGTLEKSLKTATALHERWNPNPWITERSTASGRYMELLDNHTPLHVFRDKDGYLGQKPGGPKDSRIDSLVPHVEAGRIRFNRNLHKLIGQLTGFPGDDKKDLADALEIACRHLLEGGGSTDAPYFGRRAVDY